MLELFKPQVKTELKSIMRKLRQLLSPVFHWVQVVPGLYRDTECSLFHMDHFFLIHSSWRCQDTSDPGHFGPKTFRHYQTGAEVSGQFGTSAEVSFGHFGIGAELSRPR